MPSENEIIRDKTFKEEGMDTDRRVFYTLTVDEKMTSHRTSKALATLIKLMRERQVIKESDVDDLLVECIA